jgi:SAM-dependent methyltransferase
MRTMRDLARGVLRRIVPQRFRRNGGGGGAGDLLDYWRRRADAHGARAVLNLQHPESEADAVTQMQKREIFPHLRARLAPDDRAVLDFGCGPGRFSVALAELTGGRVIAVDPIERFLSLAPKHRDVEYRVVERGRIPADDGTIDVAWVCLVLGGITDPKLLDAAAREIDRVLRPGGLLFLIENTSDKPNTQHWHFRTPDEYARLFCASPLEHLHDYDDLGERISVMAGRKVASPAADRATPRELTCP